MTTRNQNPGYRGQTYWIAAALITAIAWPLQAAAQDPAADTRTLDQLQASMNQTLASDLAAKQAATAQTLLERAQLPIEGANERQMQRIEQAVAERSAQRLQTYADRALPPRPQFAQVPDTGPYAKVSTGAVTR